MDTVLRRGCGFCRRHILDQDLLCDLYQDHPEKPGRVPGRAPFEEGLGVGGWGVVTVRVLQIHGLFFVFFVVLSPR